MLTPTSPEPQDILPSLEAHKRDFDEEQPSSSAATASGTYPHDTRDKTLPAAMPPKAPARQWPVSRVTVSPPKIPDVREPASSPPQPETSDTNLAHDAEADNQPPQPHRTMESGRRKGHGSPQAVKFVRGNLEPHQPDIAPQPGQTLLLASEPGSETDDGVGVASSLEERTETGRDETPSVESLLKEWTTLYD
jgi:hypothetical protein